MILEAVHASRCVMILISVDNVTVARYLSKRLLNTPNYSALPPRLFYLIVLILLEPDLCHR